MRKRIFLVLTLVAGLAATMLALSIGTASGTGTPGVTPQTVSFDAVPGDSFTVDKVVHTSEIPPKADIFFLADTTGSMGVIIDTVKTNAVSLLSTIAGMTSDERFGAGDYKDFQSPTQYDPYAFNPAAPIPSSDDGGAAALAAIGGWSAGGGWDGPEGQLYALHRIAVHNAATFRSGANPIVVWFGDAPGHDPVCPAISGDPDNVTEASVTAELVAAGIKVVAISTGTGYPNGLNDDPTLYGGDYNAACGTPDGSPGQASRIAAATGGADLTLGSGGIIAAILSGLSNLPVNVTHTETCSSSDVSVSVTPSAQSGTSGADFPFTETISVSPSALPGTVTCSVQFLVNGAATPEFEETVTITVLDKTPPTATCVETTNPSGGNIPNAGPNAGKSGQNPDGFYRMVFSDNVPGVTAVIADTGSAFTVGVANGEKDKITQAPGATPNWKPGAGDITKHVTLKGDAVLIATDAAGNVTKAYCKVPPPPK